MFSSDLWALGVIIFQMITGKEPFVGSSEIEVFTKITNNEYEYPDNIDANAKRLIENLLV